MTALARLKMQAQGGDAAPTRRERRFGNAMAARDWLETKVAALEPGVEVIELAVLTERWRAGQARTVMVQVGRHTDHGDVVWSDPLAASPRAGARYAR